MSLTIDEVAHILSAHKLPADQLNAIVGDLNQVESEKKEEKAVGEKKKNQLIPVILDPEGALAGRDFMGFVVQVPEETPVEEILPRIYRASYEQNRTARRKRWAFNTLGDVVESIKRKFLKNENVAIKGKQLSAVIITDGNIPRA